MTADQARPFSDPDEVPAGTKVLGGRLTIDIRIGQGGAATVYAATTSDGRDVALKVMSASYAEQEDLRQRFRNEAALAQHLGDHPRVVAPYELGELPELGGRPFITMPLVRGKVLTLLCGQLGVAEAVTLIRNLCSTVADIHDRGIIHRDIKPGNVIVGNDYGARAAYLLDFGFAYSQGDGHAPATAGLTGAHELPGTKHYMAPEQILGERPTPRFDIYALGLTLFELVTGTHPLHELSPAEAARRKCDPNQPSLTISRHKPALPEGLVLAVDSALEREPAARTQTAEAMARQLDRVLAELRGAPKPRVSARTDLAAVAGAVEVSASAPPTPTMGGDASPSVARAAPRVIAPQVGEDAANDTRGGDAGGESPRRRGLVVGAALVSLVLIVVVWRMMAPTGSEDPLVDHGVDGGQARPLPVAMLGSDTGDASDSELEGESSSSSAADDSAESSGGQEPAAGSTDSGDIVAPAERNPGTKPVRRPKIDCEDIVSRANAASDATRWREVLDLTRQRKCWPSKGERQSLRITALYSLGRYAACVAAAKGSSDVGVVRMGELCEKQRAKEASP